MLVHLKWHYCLFNLRFSFLYIVCTSLIILSGSEPSSSYLTVNMSICYAKYIWQVIANFVFLSLKHATYWGSSKWQSYVCKSNTFRNSLVKCDEFHQALVHGSSVKHLTLDDLESMSMTDVSQCTKSD